MTTLNKLLALDLDIAESIVRLNNDVPMTLIEFLEVNEAAGDTLNALDMLMIVTALCACGSARLDTGNGSFDTLTLVEAIQTKERGIDLPYIAA